MGVITGEWVVTSEHQWLPITLRIKSKFLSLVYECPIGTRDFFSDQI